MNIEEPLISFDQWLPGALGVWALVVGCLALAVIAVAMIALLTIGLDVGFDRASQRPIDWLIAVASDLRNISLRRVRALAWLTVRESTRRHGLIGFLLFLLLILPLALWFLDSASPEPAVLYITSIHFAVSVLVLSTVVLIGCTGLPNDIKQKTIYTVVTKPVRSTEIVLGRIAGCVALGTGLLVVMGVTMYLFVHSALSHRHEVDPRDMANISSPSADVRALKTGRTSLVQHHRHQVTLEADGAGATDVVQGHWHPIQTRERHGEQVYEMGGPQGQFRARVVQYGDLKFIDRFGNAAAQGTDVGEWTPHKYIFGNTLAAAIWTFEDVAPEKFPEGLRLDLNLLVKRTHKGDIERGVAGSMMLRNPRTRRASSPLHFLAREFTIDPHIFPRRLLDNQGKSIDLFEDLVDQGRVELVVQCLDKDQFFGVAPTSIYLLEREASVPINFLKGYFGLWLLMVVVASVTVMWSTFLHPSVALLAMLLTLIVGYFHDFIRKIAYNKTPGGATAESLYRLWEQKNMEQPLPDSVGLEVATLIDEVPRWVLWMLEKITPDLTRFGVEEYLAQGYDISLNLIMQQSLSMLGYTLPIFLFGYIAFKLREVS